MSALGKVWWEGSLFQEKKIVQTLFTKWMGFTQLFARLPKCLPLLMSMKRWLCSKLKNRQQKENLSFVSAAARSLKKTTGIKLIYFEKAIKLCKISTLLLSYVVPVKSKVKISQNFVAFSDYMNFNNIIILFL